MESYKLPLVLEPTELGNHSHNNLAKCISTLKTEQERNTWFIDTLYTSLTLTRKGRKLLKKWHKLYGPKKDGEESG